MRQKTQPKNPVFGKDPSWKREREIGREFQEKKNNFLQRKKLRRNYFFFLNYGTMDEVPNEKFRCQEYHLHLNDACRLHQLLSNSPNTGRRAGEGPPQINPVPLLVLVRGRRSVTSERGSGGPSFLGV